MKLKEYFESLQGIGVLATADEKGKVNVAIYARPHVIDDETVAFIMNDRLSHENLRSNPHAAYLFKESGERYLGKRLYLTKTEEKTDIDLIKSISRREYPDMPEGDEKFTKFIVYFNIDKVLPLMGAKKS